MPRIIFSEYVEPELAAIWEYIALDNIDAADRLLDSVHVTLQELARMPRTGRAWKSPHHRLSQIRSFPVKDFTNYLVFYEPLPDGISVFHILHAARDVEQFFASD